MRTCLLTLLALLVGLSVGVGLAAVHVHMSSLPPVSAEAPFAKPDAAQSQVPVPAPRVEVDEEQYNFGSMDSTATGAHSFVFRNVGDRPLTLRTGETSCKCTVSRLARDTLPPGQSAKVTLQWTAKPAMRDYQQTAVIKTNDPERPFVELTVVGRITTAVRADPQELVLTQVSADEPATAEGRLYGYLPEPLMILGHDLADPDTADYFAVATEPLSPAQLQDEKDARSGYRVRVTVKPGLPLGRFGQTIEFRTNYPSAPKIELPVVGEIQSDISLVGRGWDSRRKILALGTVSSRTGGKWTLRLVVRGPHRKEVDFKPIQVDPDLLHVDFGPSTEINAGAVILTPLVIEIPKGSRPANHLGPERSKLGRIVLETHHPQTPKLVIPIQFAIEEDSPTHD